MPIVQRTAQADEDLIDIGVSTPIAAAVAVATVGLARLMHAPNVMMLTIGLLSIIFAAGMLLVITLFCGSTTSVLIPGGKANVHFNMAPLQTSMDICLPRGNSQYQMFVKL
jgi:hypothetical protein